MSEILSVLKNKNNIEKKERKSREEKVRSLRAEVMFRAKLYEDMKLIDIILTDEEVSEVIIEVPIKYNTQFMKAIFMEEMAAFDISQVDGLLYKVKRKIINF